MNSKADGICRCIEREVDYACFQCEAGKVLLHLQELV